MPYRSFIILLLLSSMMMTACATTEIELAKDRLKVESGQIYRRSSSFTVRAVYEPELCAKGSALEHMVPAMARIGEVGANAIAFDLSGFSADGRALDPAAVETVADYALRAKDQRMVLVVRVLGQSTDAAFRKEAVRTAARALAAEQLALYWIDGADAGALAREFKSLAPTLLVAAPEHGDVQTTVDPAEAGNSGLYFLVDALPEDPWGDVNYLLPSKEETYALLDEVYTNEVEKLPWEPDNSLLSEEEQAEGFISLFNGKDLDNWWSYYHDKESFRVNEEGYIECYQSGAGGLITRDRYDNFILRLEYMQREPDANSGIHLRVPRAARQSKLGFEFQLLADHGLEEPHSTSTGSIYDVLAASTVAVNKEGEWNSVEIMLNGPHYKATLNGIVVQDVNFDEIEEMKYRLRRGFIGLQDHDDYVVFRNVRVKVLQPDSP